MKSARFIAVWLLLLALPMQGLAAFTPSARCSDAPAGQTASGGHADHHGIAAEAHAQPADHHHQQSDGQSAEQASGHSCCHHVFSGVPSAAIPGMPAPPRSITPRVLLLATLYIPELPQRPPRA
jgi:hypothetical protein